MGEIILPEPNPARIKIFKGLLVLPRPPKELRAFELWGVEEDLLHTPKRLVAALDQVQNRMDLHPIGDPQIQLYQDDATGAVGYSYVQFLRESGLVIHTYSEKDGHLDGVLATCDPNVNLDPLSKILHDGFQASIGGYVYERPYPDLENLDRLSRGRPPFEAITTTEAYRFWRIAPFDQIKVKATAEDIAA